MTTTETTLEVELDNAREELQSARAHVATEAEDLHVTVEHSFSESGEADEEHDILYDSDFVAAIIALKKARARLTDLELRQFEATED